MIRNLLVALAAISTSAFAMDVKVVCSVRPADTPVGEFGNYCVAVNGAETWGAVNSKTADNLAGAEGDISWSIANYDVDPFFNWTFTANVNGVYAVAFVLPYIGGPFSHVASSASGSLTPGGAAVTAKNATVTTQVNFAAIGQVLALADTTVNPPGSGTIPAVNNLLAFAVPAGPGTYGITLQFEHAGSGSVTYNGRVELLNLIPEPSTLGLLGTALAGLAILGRRRTA
jgi:hypothetical protein